MAQQDRHDAGERTTYHNRAAHRLARPQVGDVLGAKGLARPLDRRHAGRRGRCEPQERDGGGDSGQNLSAAH